MANLLIVDDDKNFLLSLAEGLKTFDPEKFSVFTAENGKEALEVLRCNDINLVITDIRMPEMDGVQLMAHMISNYPQIPVIVMTAFATPEIEAQLMNLGAFLYLEKPLDFHHLVEKILEGMEVSSQFFIKVLSLCSFLQMLELEKKTCTVSIRSEGRIGYLYYFQGSLIEGATGELNGARAIYEMVAWEAAEVGVEGICPRQPDNLTVPLNYIIKEEQMRMAQLIRLKNKKTIVAGPDISGSSKEFKMNASRLNQAMNILKEDLGEALLWVGIVEYTSDRVLVDYNANLKAGVMLNQVARYLMKTLKECQLPELGRYFLIELKEKIVLVAIPLKQNQWGICIDLDKATLGLFLNVTLPRIIEAFSDAAKEE